MVTEAWTHQRISCTHLWEPGRFWALPAPPWASRREPWLFITVHTAEDVDIPMTDLPRKPLSCSVWEACSHCLLKFTEVYWRSVYWNSPQKGPMATQFDCVHVHLQPSVGKGSSVASLVQYNCGIITYRRDIKKRGKRKEKMGRQMTLRLLLRWLYVYRTNYGKFQGQRQCG